MRWLFVAQIVASQFSLGPVTAQGVVWDQTRFASAAEALDRVSASPLLVTGTRQQVGRPEPSIARPILFGALLGATSWVAGGLIGYGLANTDSCSGDSFCGAGEFLLGAAIGGSSGLVVGMHLGNNRRGNFPLGLLTSLGIWGTGIGIALAMDDGVANSGGQEVVLVAIPITQFVVTLLVERATGHSRSQQAGGLDLAIVPRPDGGLGLGLSIPLP